MVFNRNFMWQIKINYRVNTVFASIIDDLPKSSDGKALVYSKQYLAVTNNNQVINYSEFCRILYCYIQMYIPRGGENPLFKAIKMFPRFVENVRNINNNYTIIELQNDILHTYFLDSGHKNVKEKIAELKSELQTLIDDEEVELIDSVIDRFEEHMREGLLSDLEELSRLLKQRRTNNER